MKTFRCMMGAALLLCLFAAVLLTGCGAAPSGAAPAPKGRITRVRCKRSHMVRTECFSFTLEEDGGAYVLSGSCFDGEEELRPDRVPVPEEKAAEVFQLLDGLELEESGSEPPFAEDRTMDAVEVCWENGAVRRAERPDEWLEPLHQCFLGLIE